jgi:hypothetical protein
MSRITTSVKHTTRAHIFDKAQTYMQESAVTNYVSVKPDLRLPKKIQGSTTYGDGSYELELEALWNEDARAYEIETLKVIRGTTPDGQRAAPVDGAVLRGVRVAQAFEYLMHNTKEILLEDGTTYELPYAFELSWEGDRHELVITPTVSVPIQKAEADRMRLLHAARIHAIATAYGVRALRLVMEVLGLQQRAASRLIEKAREQGLLDEKAPGDE